MCCLMFPDVHPTDCAREGAAGVMNGEMNPQTPDEENSAGQTLHFSNLSSFPCDDPDVEQDTLPPVECPAILPDGSSQWQESSWLSW